MRRAASFPAPPSVGVACSPRVGVPSIFRVVSGGRWACAGVIRMASDVCFGGVCWGVWWGWGGAGPPVVVCPSWVWVVVPAVVPFSSVFCPRSRPFLVLGWFPAPMWCRFRRPVPASACPHLGPLRALLPECSLVPLSLPLPLSCPFLVWWWREGRGGEGAPAAQAWGWVAWSHWRRAWGV